MSGTDGGRLLLFHAHPDDETIGTGATMARYAAAGVHVTLVTSTLGEEGEILVPALAQLAAEHADQLGGLRIGELAAAMRALGVRDHRFLGGAGRWRDSGMMGSPANEQPRAFWRAATDSTLFDEAVRAAVSVIREVRPHVVVTYDPDGGYGHPDHIMTHRVATAALTRAADPACAGDAPPWSTAKVYWTGIPASVLARGNATVADSSFAAHDDVSYGWPDDEVTTVLTNDGFAPAKARAMQAHATQIVVDGSFYALSNLLGRELTATEHYRLVHGETGELDAENHETDLFAGLA